jgi:hypothetical protein
MKFFVWCVRPLLVTATSWSSLMLTNTVMMLCRPYVDNYYNDVHLSRLLLCNSVRFCGTVRSYQGFPKNLQQLSAKLKEG